MWPKCFSRPLCRRPRVARLSRARPARRNPRMNFDPRPILLEGQHVRLEPVEERHRAPLLATAQQPPDVFQWFLTDSLVKPAVFHAWFDDALRNTAAGTEVAWTIVRRGDGKLVGSTRYLDLRRPHRALEIGNTWHAQEVQRTAINTEAKFLLLRHAFESLGAVRVQLKTDERNEPSRRAIARLGAQFEGVLRKYQTRFDGYVRNTAMFAIVADDWPAVRARLEALRAAR